MSKPWQSALASVAAGPADGCERRAAGAARQVAPASRREA